MNGDSENRPFEIIASDRVLERFNRLAWLADRFGILPEFRAAMTEIYERLELEADNLGEQMFTYHALQLALRIVAVGPAAVIFAVDPIRRTATITSFRLSLPE